MTYTATTAQEFRRKKGTLSKKLTDEFTDIGNTVDKCTSKYVMLTSSDTTEATTGIDLASGSDITEYGVFVAPTDITIVSMKDYLTEAYVKDTDDAKIELYDDADTPNEIVSRTLDALGEDVGTFTETTVGEDITAGTRIDLKAVNTASSSGTGHAIVMIEYIEQ